MNLIQMGVRTRLMLGFAALAAIVVIVSGLAIASLGRSNHRFTDYLEGVLSRERTATDIRGAATRRAIAARNLVLVTTASDIELEKAAVLKADGDVKTSLAKLKKLVADGADIDDQERTLVATLDETEAKYGPVANSIVGMALSGKHQEAITLMNNDCRPLLAQLLKTAYQFIGYEQSRAVDREQSAQATFSSDRTTMVVACVLAACLAMAMGWFLSNSVTRPLARAVSVAEAVASGDLSTDIVVDRGDETGMLLAALKKMNDSLVAMVGKVRESADGIATASAEIAMGNQDLSGRTEQQASSLQQTAASMSQMTETVQQNANSSRQASQLASSAAEVAGRGGEVVSRVVSTMGDITTASKKIADIISVIDGIAFQTNILALNAAVEAARAGEQGRGFAVVASEVRSLAQRSAQAAKEIKMLIGDSVEKVEAGSQLVSEAGATMTDIVNQVRRMTDIMSEINASTSEQSTGIAQVNQAVASIDQGTQQNAALVEESAAAAESLKQQAAGLLQVIAAFRTGHPRDLALA